MTSLGSLALTGHDMLQIVFSDNLSLKSLISEIGALQPTVPQQNNGIRPWDKVLFACAYSADGTYLYYTAPVVAEKIPTFSWSEIVELTKNK